MINQGIVPEHVRRDANYALVVEKDPLQGYLLKVSLQDAGWVVRLAEAPNEALHFCQHDLFDVAIINYSYTSEINGFELAEHLRKQYYLPSLMITASRYIELRRCPAFSLDQDLLFKPYRLSECASRLQRLIAGVPILREHRLAKGI